MKTLLTALLAASALLPAAAHAQRVGLDVDANAQVSGDRPDRGPRADRADRGPRQDRPDRGLRQDRPDRAPRQEAEVGVGADVQADRPNRQVYRRDDRQDDNWQSRRDRPDLAPDRDRDRGDDRQAYRNRTAPSQQFQGDRRDAARGRPGWQNYSAFRNDSGYRGQRYDNRDGDRFDNRGGWNRNWRSDDRYDWSRYRTANRGAYRLPRYHAPSNWGYGYRRFSIGVTLSAGLWGRNYWIDDPYDYRLPDAYGPYRWIRYYGDALLIDLRTGRVVDTVYDIFY